MGTEDSLSESLRAGAAGYVLKDASPARITDAVRRVRFEEAGNADPTPAKRTWFVDTVAPEGTISINDGSTSTSSRSVTLTLAASDPSPASGVASMRFRNGSTWSGWSAYSTSKSWTLSAGAGKKTVYAQYKDRTGNKSAATSDTIEFIP